MFHYSLNSALLEGSDRVNNFTPSQTIRPYAVRALSHKLPANLMDAHISCLLQSRSEESTQLGQKEGAKCCSHSHMNY